MALANPSMLVRRALRLTASMEAPLSMCLLLQQHHHHQSLARRAFHTSPPTLKKRKIAPAANSPPRSAHAPSLSSSSSSSSSHPATTTLAPNPEEPLDFSSLHAAFSPHDIHFKNQLQTILHGGRFNSDSLGALPVSVKSADDGTLKTFPLRELAQVVPRTGRTISLLVNDREYIKPIMSAVQSSKDFNQQPQRSEDNDLELLMKVELERKDDLARQVKDAVQGWREKIRQARTRHDKVLKGWAKDKTVLKDVVRLAERELQKVQDKKMKEIDAEEARALKQLER
ncbi:hypothetical protein E4U43_007994 [Claviceps pusilla]|uniref:Ribosome recycling factor domain-containing protein n=1 Tax=Claviceps pusilla TaxID=123648 RepID=A0A9P7SYM5_9HYPO|nr:hypothetical protein E4U43_007994 [Claviceps pusilla]